MKINKSIIALPLLGLLLTGCVGKKTYPEEDYLLNVNWGEKDEFRILQLGDIHQSQSDIHEEHFKVMDRTINASKPDLIVLNGDIFTFADKHVVKKVFQFFDDKNIPWTFTFGNHDDQGYYADNYIQRLLGGNIKRTQYKNALFKNLEDDDVTGRSNFVINVKSGDEVKYQVYCLDSNNYNFDTMGYDIVKQDQIDWYERMVNYSIGKYGNVKSSMYLHIAPPEAVIDWEKMDADNCIIGDMQEGLGSPSEDLHLVQKVLDLGATQSIHANHDHANDAVFKYTKDEKSIYFAYGVHATNRIYNDKEGVKFGGQILRVNKLNTSKLIFENYYVSYDSEEVNVVSSEGKGEQIMKALKIVLGVILTLMIAVITFFSFNLLTSFISNYQAVTKVSLAWIPMMMFMCEIYVVLFALFNYLELKRQDVYFWRKYSILMASFALVGFALSIVCGTYVYGTFVGDYVFVAYPLIMLIVHAVLLGISCYVAISSIRKIIKDKPERIWKNKHIYRLKEFFVAQLLIFGMEKLGALVLLPLFWSSYDSVYVIPFLIQLLAPIALFIIYMIDQHWKHSDRLNIILYGSVLAYTVFSLTYMLIASHNAYPTFANPLSPILQLERLVTSPVGFVILYLVSFFTSFIHLMVTIGKIYVGKKKFKEAK